MPAPHLSDLPPANDRHQPPRSWHKGIRKEGVVQAGNTTAQPQIVRGANQNQHVGADADQGQGEAYKELGKDV